MKTIDDLKVGDKAWWTDVNRKGLHEGTVTKVGRKLVTVSYYVFRKDSGRTNDAYGHQTLVPDPEAWKDRQEAARLFNQIRTGYMARGVTAADVRAAATLLGIDLEAS